MSKPTRTKVLERLLVSIENGSGVVWMRTWTFPDNGVAPFDEVGRCVTDLLKGYPGPSRDIVVRRDFQTIDAE